jgi:uncharacterized protein
MTSLYDVTVAVFIRTLGNLDHILGKAEASGIADLPEARLIDDMLPLSRQVQMASDAAKFFAIRVGQTDPLPMPDEEKTLGELRQRIAKTIAYLEGLDAGRFEGREDAEVIMKLPNGEMPFTGLSYATIFALPNFFFHVTTAYAILRSRGVALGKMDYLAGANPPA